MSTSAANPQRGELWRVNFDPTIGAEIQKTRPAVVISADGLGILPLRLVVPITGWQASFSPNIWHVKVEPDSRNGLAKTSAIDALQVRGVSILRFRDRIGRLSAETLEEVAAAIAAVVEFQ